MGGDLNPAVLMRKALRACASARVLLDLNDVDGACSRAYYAMFDAARAALLAARIPNSPETGKTHSGLISAFGLYLVKSGLVDKTFGRMLKRAEEVRIVADYRGDSVELADALEMVEQAEDFVAAMQIAFVPELNRLSGD